MKTVTLRKPTMHPLHRVLFLLLTGLSGNISLHAQCVASSTNNAGAVIDDASTGVLAFANPGNATPSDNNRANASATLAILTGTTHYLKATGFNFNIPSYSTICGIRVEIEKSAGGIGVLAWVDDNAVRLVKNNVISGNNMAISSFWSGTESYSTYGGPAQMWGQSLTPADVNSSNFGVAISAAFEGVAILLPSARVDNIRMTVFYNPVLPTQLTSFSSFLKKNIVQLQWQTTDEEDDEYILLQRSANKGPWTDIARFDMHSDNNLKTYTYSDVLADKGNYSYRLQIVNHNGFSTYSAVKNISYGGNPLLSLYPNPSKDFIFIDNVTGISSLSVTNIGLQQLRLPLQEMGNGVVRADIRQLPRGIYFASIDGRAMKFLKD